MRGEIGRYVYVCVWCCVGCGVSGGCGGGTKGKKKANQSKCRLWCVILALCTHPFAPALPCTALHCDVIRDGLIERHAGSDTRLPVRKQDKKTKTHQGRKMEQQKEEEIMIGTNLYMLVMF